MDCENQEENLSENLIWAFDIGSRSIGWAVMRAGDEASGFRPTGEVVDAGVVIHSGGLLSEKDGKTRHAARGEVVRARRRLKRRKTRRRKLKDQLADYDLVLQDGWRQRDPWWARSVLASGPVEDPHRVRHLMATALPHMARHRGWRNPWLRAPDPVDIHEVDEKKSADIVKAAQDLTDETGEPVPPTLGAISWALIQQKGPSKIRQSSNETGEGQRNINDWIEKVHQEFIASELFEIWKVQRQAHRDLFTDQALKDLSETVLHQVKPGVPLERIGKCEIDDRFYRAPRSSPIYQRYRLLALAANLRRELPSGERDPLSGPEKELVVDLLSRGEETSWAEIEEALDWTGGKLVHADRAGTAGRPPVHVVAERLKSTKGINKLRKWWDQAESEEQEALVAIAISDLGFNEENPDLLEEVANEIEREGLLELVEKFGRTLPPGRASYCRQVLTDLNGRMEAGRDLHDATGETYGHGAAGAQKKWEDPIPNNGVELSMKEVRKVVARLEAEHGVPSVIGVEIVRDASMSHAERNDRSARIQRERGSREEAKRIVTEDLGYREPSPSVVTKQEHITAQGGVCLYCGDRLRLPNTELDHIVPRSTGGATIFNNLAAVCRDCNQKKGHQPFGLWCEESGESGAARLEETLSRVDGLTGPRWKPTPAKPYINPETGRWVYSELELARRDYRRRLKKTGFDREFDAAELTSTAFVGRAVTERLKRKYPDARVDVFRGGFTAAMRNETGLSKRLGLGAKKDRGDRRHHAMDAIAVALMTNATWTRRVRVRNEAFQNRRLDLLSDEKLEEVRAKADIDSLAEVMPTVEATGGELIEHMIPVLPRRLSTTGRIHEDTVRPWHPKRIGDAWNAKTISSVRDQEVASTLWRLSSPGGSVKEDRARTLELSDGSTLGPDDTTMCAIKIDDESGRETPVATWMPVRMGWAKTDEIHHARIVTATWAENGREKSSALLVTVPVSDVYESINALERPLSPNLVGVRGNLKLARVFSFDPTAEIETIAVMTQGDILDIQGELWTIFTFSVETQQIMIRPALAGGEGAKALRSSFVPSTFQRGEISQVSNHLPPVGESD
ncbi:MAG: HNH endonuclease [Solirubrobacterales bacterium]|nr:HNH endonuclease [Solirubrobacterales bacterium]